MTTRRQLIAGILAAPFVLRTPAALAEEDLIMRRTPNPGEDDAWFALSQNGPFNPEPQPAVLPFGAARLVVHYPRGPSGGRLLVFSHAALTDPQVYRPLLQHLVSHGFVVVAPVHDDSVFEHGVSVSRTLHNSGSTTWDVGQVLNDISAWENRVEACRSAIEHPKQIGDAIRMTINAERPIIMGHEFGAYVAGLVLGATVDDNGEKVTKFRDDRWYAGVQMSPQGAGIMGLTKDSWKDVTKPLLVVEGAMESDFTLQSPMQKIDPFSLSAPGNKHLAWFNQGRRTMYVSAHDGSGQGDTPMTEDLRAILTAYVKAYGNYDQDLFQRIASDWPERATLGRVTARYR